MYVGEKVLEYIYKFHYAPLTYAPCVDLCNGNRVDTVDNDIPNFSSRNVQQAKDGLVQIAKSVNAFNTTWSTGITRAYNQQLEQYYLLKTGSKSNIIQEQPKAYIGLFAIPKLNPALQSTDFQNSCIYYDVQFNLNVALDFNSIYANGPLHVTPDKLVAIPVKGNKNRGRMAATHLLTSATFQVATTPEVRLKRFLYTCSEVPTFRVGDPNLYKAFSVEKVPSVIEILQSENPQQLLNIIEIANSEGMMPIRDPIFFALALAHKHSTNEKLVHNIYTTLLIIIKGPEDLFKFLQFHSALQMKIGTAVKKLIQNYYFNKDPLVLAYEVTLTKGYHSWTHKDLMKLIHYRCDSILIKIVMIYVMHGIEEAKVFAERNTEAAEIMTILTNVTRLKRSENEALIANLIPKLQCNLKQIPTFYHHSELIWKALVPELSVTDLLLHLTKLYNLGFLKDNLELHTKVIEILQNAERIRSSKIHPVEVFIRLRNFQKGGKPMHPLFSSYLQSAGKHPGPKVPPTCPRVINALYKTLDLSFNNPKCTGRRIIVGIEISKKIKLPCIGNKNISCLDAATILLLSLVKTENVVGAVFNDRKLTFLSLNKNTSFSKAQEELTKAQSGRVRLSTLFRWSISQNRPFDVFIMIFHHRWFTHLSHELRIQDDPSELVSNYRTTMSLPNTKLISLSLWSSKPVTKDSTNILNICGFTKEVPKIIEAFSLGLFH
ncbi:hypothetical protein FQA39_LY15774 [Lamprigera yunnana]|nr:hypothetical protein FQA39_LY15774 [Lamprigera yunnana]